LGNKTATERLFPGKHFAGRGRGAPLSMGLASIEMGVTMAVDRSQTITAKFDSS